MKTDLYTKAVLSVIAIALCVIVFQNTHIVSTAQASRAVNIVAPAPQERLPEIVDVNIVQIDGSSISGINGLPVEVKNTVKVSKSSW